MDLTNPGGTTGPLVLERGGLFMCGCAGFVGEVLKLW